MTRRELEAELRSLGAFVGPVRKTGEHGYRHPLMPTRIRINMRKKDAAPAAVTWLRQLRKKLEEQS